MSFSQGYGVHYDDSEADLFAARERIEELERQLRAERFRNRHLEALLRDSEPLVQDAAKMRVKQLFELAARHPGSDKDAWASEKNSNIALQGLLRDAYSELDRYREALARR